MRIRQALAPARQATLPVALLKVKKILTGAKKRGDRHLPAPSGFHSPLLFPPESEVNRETQLDDPGRKGDRTDGAKGRLVADVGIRVAPDMAVEQIEEIGP